MKRRWPALGEGIINNHEFATAAAFMLNRASEQSLPGNVFLASKQTLKLCIK
jgi:hypothetical protein